MNLSVRDRKILWGKAGNRCSYRYRGEICDAVLVVDDDSKVDKDTVVGIECHIVGEGRKAARYIKEFPQRQSYENAILLCGKHHKVVDDNENIYTIDILREMKESHEDEMKSRGLVIEDYDLYIEAKNADEVEGMKVTKPAQIRKVRSKIKAENVGRVTGLSTDQGVTSKRIVCSHCGKPDAVAFTGPPPPKVRCRHCGEENDVK